MRRVEVRVLFHERGEMESAVRDLVDEGFRKRRIRVARATREGRPVQEGGSAAATGALVGTLLGLVAVLVGLLSLPSAPPFWAALVRLVSAAAGGAMLGGLAGLLVGARRPRRDAGASPHRDWLIRVRAAESEAEHVRRVLRSHGGEPVPA
jgi:hypothetical protein